jgi:hypothetical protein
VDEKDEFLGDSKSIHMDCSQNKCFFNALLRNKDLIRKFKGKKLPIFRRNFIPKGACYF